MPDNPLSGPPSPPGGIAQNAEAMTALGDEMAGIGRDTLATQRRLEVPRYGYAAPAAGRQMQIGARGLEMAGRNEAVYESQYRPVEMLQVMDSVGGSWLAPEEREKMLRSMASAEKTSLLDAYRANTRSRKAAYEQNKAMLPDSVTNPAQVGYTAPGAGGAGAGPGILIDGATGQPVPNGGQAPSGIGPNPRDVAYQQEYRAAQQNYRDDQQGINRALEQAIMMSEAQDAAEQAAVSRAQGDVFGAERRHEQGLAMEAGRMGVDPSRALAASGAMMPSRTAAAVDAGNRARFGIRGQRTASIGNTANFGRQMPAAAAGGYGLSMAGTGAGVGTMNSAINSTNSSATAALPYFGQAMEGYRGGGNLMNADYANRVQAYANNPITDIAGTGLGMWAGGGFKLPG